MHAIGSRGRAQPAGCRRVARVASTRRAETDRGLLAMSKPEVLALIPARGGSKSVPRKNLLQVAGKPLIAYSIGHALECTKITRTIVSTDDDEIADVARRFGAEVPFR